MRWVGEEDKSVRRRLEADGWVDLDDVLDGTEKMEAEDAELGIVGSELPLESLPRGWSRGV
jgi:hypothetical protein